MAEKKNNREIRADVTPDELAILRIIRRVFASMKRPRKVSGATQFVNRDPSLQIR